MNTSFDLQWRSYWISHNYFTENSFTSKLKIIGEFRHAFGIVGKPSMRKVNEGDLEKNYTWGVRDIKFLLIFVNGNSIMLQKMSLKGKISWVTSSHLGQGHKLY